MLNLSHSEKQSIVDAIRPVFKETVQLYDTRKYPEDEYERLQLAFRSPASVTRDDIRDAFLWKYGHWRKEDYPEKHKIIIAKIQAHWENFLGRQALTPEQVYDHWADVLKEHQSFITVTFLLHLLRSDEIPITDQHNFRAMNHYLKMVRQEWVSRKKPSELNDVFDLREFMQSIQAHWSSCGYPGAPTSRLMDKYLMTAGRLLKQDLDDRLNKTWPADATLGGPLRNGRSSYAEVPYAKIWTLGSENKRTQFDYSGTVSAGVRLLFTGKPYISPEFFTAILRQFSGSTIPGGFSMTEPTPGGLGEWVRANSKRLNGIGLTPRHASFIAAILVHEGLISSNLKGNAIFLHF
jgi:hypothetical protein